MAHSGARRARNFHGKSFAPHAFRIGLGDECVVVVAQYVQDDGFGGQNHAILGKFVLQIYDVCRKITRIVVFFSQKCLV